METTRRRSPCSSRIRRRRRGAAVGRRLRQLRRLVPGVAAMPADRLLLRTADYILQLRARVELLRALSKLCVLHGHGGAHGDDGDSSS